MKNEPAVLGAAFAALINGVVLILLKHELSPEARDAIVLVVTTGAGFFIRSKVSPVA
jgi:hypothetical protein